MNAVDVVIAVVVGLGLMSAVAAIVIVARLDGDRRTIGLVLAFAAPFLMFVPFGLIGFFLLVALGAMLAGPWVLVFGAAVAIGLLLRLWREWRARRAAAAAPVEAVVPIVLGDPQATAALFETISAIADRNGISRDHLPNAGFDDGRGRRFAYVEGDAYVFAVNERGYDTWRSTTTDRDELLYWVFAEVTDIIAANEETARLMPGGDFHKRYRERQGRMLQAIDPGWHRRWLHERMTTGAPV